MLLCPAGLESLSGRKVRHAFVQQYDLERVVCHREAIRSCHQVPHPVWQAEDLRAPNLAALANIPVHP